MYFITSNPLFNIFQSIILHPDSSCTLELLGLVGWGGRRLTIDVFKEKGKWRWKERMKNKNKTLENEIKNMKGKGWRISSKEWKDKGEYKKEAEERNIIWERRRRRRRRRTKEKKREEKRRK